MIVGSKLCSSTAVFAVLLAIWSSTPDRRPNALSLSGSRLHQIGVDMSGHREVRVRTLDRSGNPVRSATCQVIPVKGSVDEWTYFRPPWPREKRPVDENGQASTMVPDYQDAVIVAEAPGFAPTTLVVPRLGAVDATITLNLPAELSAHVVSPLDGKGVPNATVTLEDQTGTLQRTMMTDSDGRFVASGMWAGPCIVLVTSKGHARMIECVELRNGAATVQDFRLRPGFRLRVRAVDSRSKTPVPDATMRLDGTSVATDANGIAVFDDVGAENVVVESWSPRHFRSGSIVAASILAATFNHVTDIHLGRGIVVSGVVLDQRRVPVSGAAVGRTAWNGAVAHPREGATTDASGRFTICVFPSSDNEETESVELVARHPTYGFAGGIASPTVNASSGQVDPVELVMSDRTATLVGTLVNRYGEPIANALMVASPSPIDRIGETSDPDGPIPNFRLSQTRTNARGEFTLSGLQEPGCDVYVRDPNITQRLPYRVELTEGGVTTGFRMRVELNELSKWAIPMSELERNSIRGVVIDEAGLPIRGAEITGSNQHQTVSDTNGGFILPSSGSRPISIHFAAYGYKLHSTSVEADENDVKVVIKRSPNYVRVRGVVSGGLSRKPLEGIRVSFGEVRLNRSYQDPDGATSDADGVYDKILKRGVYVVSTPNRGWESACPFKVRLDSDALNLNVEFLPTARVEVLVENDSRSSDFDLLYASVFTEGVGWTDSFKPMSPGLLCFDIPGAGRHRIRVIAGRRPHPLAEIDPFVVQVPVQCVVDRIDWLQTSPNLVHVHTMRLPATVPIDLTAVALDHNGMRTQDRETRYLVVTRHDITPSFPHPGEDAHDWWWTEGGGATVNTLSGSTHRIYMPAGRYSFGASTVDVSRHKSVDVVLGKVNIMEFLENRDEFIPPVGENAIR